MHCLMLLMLQHAGNTDVAGPMEVQSSWTARRTCGQKIGAGTRITRYELDIATTPLSCHKNRTQDNPLTMLSLDTSAIL